MSSKDALKASMAVHDMVVEKYLSDFSDEDIYQRPAEGCNHLAWQLGHLIGSEVHLLEQVCPGKAATLPDGFAEKHTKETASIDDPTQFYSKQEYLDLYRKVRQQTVQTLDDMSDEQLAQPSPENFREMFPQVLHIFTLIASHPMMHAGQFVVARRKLGKPIVM